MKAIHLWPLLAVLMAGCMNSDPEARLYQVVSRTRTESQPWTIYNCPSVYLTSKEQQVRQGKQAESIRRQIVVGMAESQLAAIWGRPNDIKKSTYPGGRFDTFVYESTGGKYMQRSYYYFVFRDKTLESWHRA